MKLKIEGVLKVPDGVDRSSALVILAIRLKQMAMGIPTEGAEWQGKIEVVADG